MMFAVVGPWFVFDVQLVANRKPVAYLDLCLVYEIHFNIS